MGCEKNLPWTLRGSPRLTVLGPRLGLCLDCALDFGWSGPLGAPRMDRFAWIASPDSGGTATRTSPVLHPRLWLECLA